VLGSGSSAASDRPFTANLAARGSTTRLAIASTAGPLTERSR
jgi:hypothetical protein